MASDRLQPPDDLRVRAFAVAKLKRAASLPRMKDGRRPPMHGEAVSEGERATPSPIHTTTTSDEENPESAAEEPRSNMVVDDSSSTPATPHATSDMPVLPPPPPPATQPEEVSAQELSQPSPLAQQQEKHEPEGDQPESETVREPEEEPESAQSRTTTPVTQQRRKKRRSRSRSRSRSRDLNQAMSQSRSDSPEDAAPPPLPKSPFLASTTPSPRIAIHQPPPYLPQTPPRPYNMPSQSPFFQVPTSPSPLPSLDAIRAGLIRSNSAAGRMMAFHKLTGGKESPEPMRLSPSPTPLITRSNTVTGGERMAARNIMMRRLGERLKEADGETPSTIIEEPTVTPTRRRPIPPDLISRSPGLTPRRSPQTSNSGIVDDRETSETSPNSPDTRPMALPETESAVPTPIPDTTNERYNATHTGALTPGSSAFDYRRTATTEASNLTQDEPFEYDGAEVRDGVVIERDEPEGSQSHQRSFKAAQDTNPKFSIAVPPQPVVIPRNGKKRVANHPSDTSSTLTASATEPIPVFMPAQGQSSPYKQDTFPVTIGPFSKESIVAESEEEGETVVYPEDTKARKPWLERLEVENKATMSWNSNFSPVGPSNVSYWSQNMELAEEEDEDDVPVPKMPERPQQNSLGTLHSNQNITASFISNVSTDIGASSSPETPLSAPGTSPSPAYGLQRANRTPSERASHESESASIATASSPRADSAAASLPRSKAPDSQEATTDPEDAQNDKEPTLQPDTKEKPKKGESPWQKVKAFTRSGSSMGMGSGRRSRSNSFINGKREDSSRESAASGNSVTNLASPTMNPAASSSMLSLAPGVPPPRGGVSPVPPASAADLARFADHSKLQPFPGLAKLQEEKKQRDRGLTGSLGDSSLSSSGVHLPDNQDKESILERRPSVSKQGKGPSPQRDETSSLARNGSVRTAERPNSPASTKATSNTTGGLPVNKEGVRKWLHLNKWLPSSQEPQPHGVEIVPPGTAMKPPERKPSLSDIFATNRISDNSATEREDASRSIRSLPLRNDGQEKGKEQSTETTSGGLSPLSRGNGHSQVDPSIKSSVAMSLSPDLPPVATPSSVNTFPMAHPPAIAGQPSPNPSLALSFASTQILHSQEGLKKLEERKTAVVLQRLDTILEQASRDPSRASALESPPRKLLLMSKACQVLDRNTIKDRYLFLFTDILVIAKPMDEEHGRDTNKAPLDHMFAVKSIVELTKLEFDREPEGSPSGDFNQHPSVKAFVQRFAKDPDHAISTIIEKTKLKDDPTTIANLLFRTLDLDKAQLGEYLSRRSNKNILKGFIDRFGFAGVRIDNALRAFLLSIRLPADAILLEHLLITFARRWFDANTGVVTYDKELAVRLVLAMMQLNDALHSGGDEEMTPAAGVFSFPNPNISAQDFIDAFRVSDRRQLVSDESLRAIYESVKAEKLAQALPSSVAPIRAAIDPAAMPTRLTSRIHSDFITIRIPAPDPQFAIYLQGEDLLFEPSTLSFAHSAEASFRVIGNTLGAKTAIFARTGAHANLYTGIPLSKTFYVERAFMRNTFRVAFTNHAGLQRRYLFSVENKADHANWSSMIERQIAKCKSEPLGQPLGPVSVKVRRAAEAVALRVLRDALIVPDEPSKGETQSNAKPGQRLPYSLSRPSTGQQADTASTHPPGPVGSVKNGHDLLVACQQNSLIPLVLSFLNVVKPI